MNTNRTTRFAELMLAVAMTGALHGAMLWKFDAVAQQATQAGAAAQSATVISLQRVTIVAPHS